MISRTGLLWQLLSSLALVVVAVSRLGGQSPDSAAAPAPLGKLFDVGGHTMHLYCTGTGTRTVLLESGAGAFSVDWYFVQRELSKTTRVCSYDRAGHAWSEPGPQPHTKAQAVLDLHALLGVAHVKAPYVLVGHSSGGDLVRLFATRYPAEVSGMVLVDVPVENTIQFPNGRATRAFAVAQPRQVPPPHQVIVDSERTLSPAELDGVRQYFSAVGKPVIDGPFEKLPPDMQRIRLWAMSQPAVVTSENNPFEGEELVLMMADRIRRAHLFGDIPLVVLARTPDTLPAGTAPTSVMAIRINERPLQLQQLAELSTNSAVFIADSSRHEIHLDQPTIVVGAVRWALGFEKQKGSALRDLPGAKRLGGTPDR
jgi:pimeloyl-ACP methyl ester carboxylesterase